MAIEILTKEKYYTKCKTCGCEFLYESSDIRKISNSGGKHPIRKRVGVICPACSDRIEHVTTVVLGLDPFGKLVRDIRITRSLLLYDMAKTLGISPAELSAIECGRKPVPDWFIPSLEQHYDIGEACAKTLAILAKERAERGDVYG